MHKNPEKKVHKQITTNTFRYQMIIFWSDEDDCYLVHLPDFPEQTYRTHGESYEEAAKNGTEVLQLLLEEDGLPLPAPTQSTASLPGAA